MPQFFFSLFLVILSLLWNCEINDVAKQSQTSFCSFYELQRGSFFCGAGRVKSRLKDRHDDRMASRRRVTPQHFFFIVSCLASPSLVMKWRGGGVVSFRRRILSEVNKRKSKRWGGGAKIPCSSH
ncbi:hypothetical protein F5H01DRAFT_13949 [Linnemannia elongata]|nr:hypothetical protein F5H01DRAFT_13949 [Linnemannia elongata]